MVLTDWDRLTSNSWINNKNDLRLEIDYVEYVPKGLHHVVSIKSPNYMSMKLEEEKAFNSRIKALNYAKKYMRTH
jgi:hypothetical protein